MSLLTKRFPTLIGLALLVAGIVGAFYYFQGTATKTSTEIVPAKVIITNISDNKFSVSWTTVATAPGSVEYGVVGEKLTSIAKDERDTASPGQYITHHVTLEGLQPSTQYAFRILSGPTPTRFDNNGSPYTATTGPVIGATPASQNFYGNVELASKQPAGGTIVYLTLPGGSTSSTLVKESGNYAFTLSTMRTSDSRSYIKFDPSATIASVTVESGTQQTTSSVSLANSAPVPPIIIGQNIDFLNAALTPTIAQVQEPGTSSTSASSTPDPLIPLTAAPSTIPSEIPQTPSIFNVEPLTSTEINAVTTGAVTILNPKEAGETLLTLRPEFRGTGTAGTTLSIALTGQKAVNDSIQVATDGTWSWAPVIDLRVGKQKITVSYNTTGGTTQKVEREFNISTSKTGLDPAFVSSPSASTTTSSTVASTKPSVPSPTPRVAMPATESGVPVTGVIQNTLLTGGLGIVIMIVGAILLSL